MEFGSPKFPAQDLVGDPPARAEGQDVTIHGRRGAAHATWRIVACVVALLVLAVACGGDDGDDDATAAPSSTATGDSGSEFPVEVPHRFGTTEVAGAPERVVTVGLSDQDAVLALGVRPVGVVDWYGDYEDAVWPWQEELFGDERPTVVGDASSLNYEAIAELEPDLIQALYSGLTEEDYELLAAIAPTVAQPADHEDYLAPWQVSTRLIGQALGRPAEADALVADVEELFAAARADHPEFDGLSAAAAAFNSPGRYHIYEREDPKSQFLETLGFSIPEAISELPGGDGNEVSAERFDLVDQDLAVWFTSTTPELIPELEASPVYQQLDVHTEGRDLFLDADDTVVNGAISWSTVLSLPIAIEELVPRLPAVVDGDPATD
jgi:iron complex transport system substrate-binding protein